MGAVGDGIILGLLLSGMIGPIFFYMINVGVTKGIWSGMLVSFGAFLSDLVLLVLIYYFSAQFDFTSKATYLNFIGGIVFFMVGIGGFFKKNGARGKISSLLTVENTGFKPFFHGALINTFNPGVIIFWIGAMSSVLAKQEQDYSLASYFIAAVLTILCLDFVKIFVSAKVLNTINPKVFKALNPIVSLVLVAFGLNLLRKGLWP